MNNTSDFSFVCRRKTDRRSNGRLMGGEIKDTNRPPIGFAAQVVHLLTSRERDVLLLMVDGRTDKQIAASLNLSQKTVQHYVQGILVKIGAKNRTQAVVKALCLGLVDIRSIA